MAANLITLEDTKVYLTITSDKQDTMINLLIPKISQLVKNYCGRTLIDYFTNIKEEVYNGGLPKLYVQETPVRDILLVSYSTDYGQTYNDLTPFVDYFYNKQDDSIDPVNTTEFPLVPNGYKINYRGGYDATPEDLKLACMDLVSYYLKSDMAVKSNRAAGSNTTQIEYVTNATLPSNIRRVLDTYRFIL